MLFHTPQTQERSAARSRRRAATCLCGAVALLVLGGAAGCSKDPATPHTMPDGAVTPDATPGDVGTTGGAEPGTGAGTTAGTTAGTSGGTTAGTTAGTSGGTTAGTTAGTSGGTTAGTSGGTTAGTSGGTTHQVRLPPANAGFDYQIGGAYPPPAGVGVVSRDRGDQPAAGLYNICYVNGFQAQPGEDDFWLDEHPTLVLRDDAGDPIIDEDWDEMILDVGSDTKRAELSAIVGGWIAGCATDGYDAVEIDNLDTFSRSRGRLSMGDAVAFIRLLADRAHAEGLAIAQKNAAEMVRMRDEMGTDFVVAEECNQWNECDVFTDAYDDQVFVVEYQRSAFQAGCSSFPNLSIVLRDLNVSPAGSRQYVFEDC